jgi:hypothetical protein
MIWSKEMAEYNPRNPGSYNVNFFADSQIAGSKNADLKKPLSEVSSEPLSNVSIEFTYAKVVTPVKKAFDTTARLNTFRPDEKVALAVRLLSECDEAIKSQMGIRPALAVNNSQPESDIEYIVESSIKPGL